MPYCPSCKEERGGKFCSSCGGRVVERKTSTGGGGGSRPGNSSPTASGATSPTAAAAAAPRAMQRSSNAIGRQSLASIPDTPAGGSPPAGVQPPPAPSSTSPSPSDNYGAKKANLTQEACALIQHRRSEVTNTRVREVPITVSSGKQSSRITVAVRKRPLNPNETQLDVVPVRSLNGLYVLESKRSVDGTQLLERHQFAFDEVFDETDDNPTVYKRTAKRLMDDIFNGGFCCCFAYGQTGSGKTYTMMGSETNLGIYLQAANEIFHRIEDQPLCVAVSFYEIYAAKLYDLLNGKEQIHSREDENQRVHIRGLTEHLVNNSTDLMELVRRGLDSRSQSSTVMNDESSRSHAIMEIKLKLAKSGKLIGKLSVIDLAGSERASVGHAGDKQVQMEGAEINKSLLALKECIRALDQGQRHIPFRQSELTQILKESFLGENGHTMMIANISCSADSCVETLNTLRYADRVKGLQVAEEVQQAEEPRPTARRGSAAPGGLRPSESSASVASAASQRGSLAFAEKKCPGCGSLHRNYAFLEAHKEMCALVTISCDYCPTSFKRKDLDKHHKTCTKIPVECKQCGDLLPRDQIKRHQSVECPKSETSCLFCRRKLMRQELEGHKDTCEQRVVECDECDAKVKVSLMTTHKRTCKKTKRDSLPASAASSAASTPANSSFSKLARGSQPTAAPEAVGERRSSKAGSTSDRSNGDASKSPSPSSAAREAAPTSTSAPYPPRKKPSVGGAPASTPTPTQVTPPPPEVASPAPAPAPTAPTPTPAPTPAPSSGAPCALLGLGCCGGTSCSSDEHLKILTLLCQAQMQENASLRQDLVAMDDRVKRLEAYNDQLRQLHSGAQQAPGSKVCPE